MLKKGFGGYLAALLTLIWIITFIVLGIIWKINLISLIIIIIGGAIFVWYITLVLLNFISILISFFKKA